MCSTGVYSFVVHQCTHSLHDIAIKPDTHSHTHTGRNALRMIVQQKWRLRDRGHQRWNYAFLCVLAFANVVVVRSAEATSECPSDRMEWQPHERSHKHKTHAFSVRECVCVWLLGHTHSHSHTRIEHILHTHCANFRDSRKTALLRA